MPSALTPRHFGFGFCAISDVYKVVLFRTYRCKGLEVMVLTVGSGIWRRIGKVNVEVKTEYGVLHDGFLHWICKTKRSGSLFIRAFDVATERFKDIPLPPYTFDNCNETGSHIGVLKGSLSITFCSIHTSVWVMKEHGVAKSWAKELEIEDVSDFSNGTFTPIVTRGHIYNPPRRNFLQVLKFLDKGEVLLFDNVMNYLYSYTPATKNLLRVEVDGSIHVKFVATVHVPSFVSPKDIIRNYISKHPEEGVGTSSPIEVSDIKMSAWTTSVAGWGENEENELLEIPQGRPTPCLSLPEDLKYVSSATATSLLDMISGLDALLLHKCKAGKDEIQKLRKDNEDLRARARLRLERKISVQMILYLMALILMPFMSYLAVLK